MIKAKKIGVVIFSFVVFLFITKLLYQFGIIADEYSVASKVIMGSIFWLYLCWLLLFLSFVVFIISLFDLIKK